MKRIVRLLIMAAVVLVLTLTACDALVTTQTPTPIEDSTTTPTATEETPDSNEPNLLEEILVERTPLPTALPGPVQKEVERMVARAGLTRTQILGLTVSDWISLLLSGLYVFIGYLVATLLTRRVIRKVFSSIFESLDQHLINKISSSLRWLVVVFIAFLAIRGLSFISDTIRTILVDFYFVAGIILSYGIVSNLIRLAEDWYHSRSVEQDREEEFAPVITLLVRVARLVNIIFFITIFLSHFGINITAFAAALGIGGLAFSLAARDTIADAIAGFIILVDRPFRIGDRIEIQGVGTWGDVIDIGLRTTRIRTRDNRMVIVPNSIIGSNQVINFSYPDPQYRIETRVGVAYGTDIEKARNLIVETVSSLDVVLKDKPVDALYSEMGDSAMVFLVRWWIESYVDTRRVVDRVHTALQNALDEAGIESPYPTQNLHLKVETQVAERLVQLLGKS